VKELEMQSAFSRQAEVMERSGLGLLPGIALAFVVALFFIAAILISTWWASALAAVGTLSIAGFVVWIVWRLVLRDDAE
jgi:predicted RND superfamily exporter protein